MSASAALQTALIAALLADPGLAAHLGQRIWDNAPAEPERIYPYLSLGPAQELDDSAECIDGVECFQQIDIWTREGGSQLSAKQICGSVKRALHGVDLSVSGGFVVVLLEIESVRVVGDPDNKIAHGIVSLRALMEG